jgi:hypothetical protein
VGGVYLDAKSTATRPLDEVIRPDDVYLLSQWQELRDRPAGQGAHPELQGVPGDEYVNWFLVCAPGHPFLRAVILRVLDNIARYRVFEGGVGRKGVLRLTGPIAYTLAIHPIRQQHPHRLVKFEEDPGFRFSVFGDPFRHRSAMGTHYSELVRPVVRAGPLATAAAALWYGRAAPLAGRLRGRLARRGG